MQPEIALVRAGSRRCGPDGRRGWNMIENWEDAAFETDGRVTTFRTEHKEFCNSSFRWRFGEMEDGGVSIGKTLPAIPTEETSSPLVLYSLILKRTEARTAAVPVGLFDGQTAEVSLVLSADREHLALAADRRVVYLDGGDIPAREHRRREAVEQHADVGDVIHMVSGVDVGRADGVGEHLVRRGEVVVKARGRVRDARAAAIGIIRREHVPYEREQASLRLEHGPLRPPEGEQLVPAAETVATVAAQRVMAARLRPSGGGDLCDMRALPKKSTRVCSVSQNWPRAAMASLPTPVYSACSEAMA